MNILFLTIGTINTIEEHDLYPDLLREFRKEGNNVYIVSPRERRAGLKTELQDDDKTKILHVRTGNITKCNFIEKGISTVFITLQFKKAIKKYFSNIKFDLILYSTPPVTFEGVVNFIKNRDHAFTYLLLKDIFPQNSVDIGIMKKEGIQGLAYKYFRRQEKQLYALSDTIGCMSQANCDYLLSHNPEISQKKVEVCPNSIDPVDRSVNFEERASLRMRYEIPLDKTVFVYGGNLGKPQGIQFIIESLKNEKLNTDIFILIIGDGTEFHKLEEYITNAKQKNVRLMKRLPKEDYDQMIGSCDVGLIFLDHRFTIPNFPSRLLSYMQAKLPVLAVTDPHTDIGQVITDGGFGWWCESDDVDGFAKIVGQIPDFDLLSMGERAYDYLNQYYTAAEACRIITKSCGRG